MRSALERGADVVGGIRWIRLLYAHPAHVTDRLIEALRDLPRVVPYLDIPLQHIADDLLKAMRRETDGRRVRALIERLRARVPGIAIRTTFIVGFPGETEAHVEELAQFMEETRFERLGIFPYSPEPKTPAEKLPHPVPEKVREERFHRLMSLQQRISEMVNRAWLGREIEVLMDEPGLGRTYADAPEVDGLVHVKASQALRPGQFVQARVTDTTEYDLVAQTIDPAQAAA
jgi:ribosomal protein S12 methylthiotransferase